MADEAPVTVKMEILRDGTGNGVSYVCGDHVDVDEATAEAFEAAGFAVRIDRVERATKTRAAVKAAAEKAKADAEAAATNPPA